MAFSLLNSSVWRHSAVRYALALGATAASAVLRWAMPDVLGRAPYLGFYPAVVLAAILGGVGPGLFATLLSLLLVNFVFAQFNLLDYGLQMRNVIWVLGSVGVSLLAGWVHAARHQAEAEMAAARTAQRAVEASEEQFRTLANAIPQLCWMANGDGWIFWYNQGWYDYTGATPEQMEGWGWQSVHDPAALPKVLERWKASIATGEPFDMVFPLRGADGVFRPFLTRINPVRDETGKVVRWFGTNTDISERQRTEEQLEASRQMLQTIVNHIPASVALIREGDLRIELVNPAYQAIAPDKEMVGKSLDELWPETGQDFATICRRVLATGEPYHVMDELNMISRAPGAPPEPAYFSWSLHRVQLAGNECWGLLNTAWETTARKRVEAELRESEHRLMIAKDAAELGIHDYDIASGMIQWDQRVRRLWGVSADEPITYETFICGVHPDDRAAVQASLEQALSPGGDGRYSAEYRVHSRIDGTERWVFATGTVFFDQGRAVRLVGTAQDITERKRSMELLVRSEKVAALGRMAATLAHDINNPLSAVMNAIFLARCNPKCATCEDSVQPFLETADQELKRVSHITQQALGFYREGSTPAKVAIRNLLDETVDIFRSRTNGKNITVEKQYRGEVIEVVAISGELRQIFSNLFANSLDAVGQNGTIKLRVASFGRNRVRITIADDGTGIAPGSMPRIFEPLFTTKGSLGTGLGLWVTKQLVDKHGGTIRVRSSANGSHRGTTFSVVLPGTVATHQQAATTA